MLFSKMLGRRIPREPRVCAGRGMCGQSWVGLSEGPWRWGRTRVGRGALGLYVWWSAVARHNLGFRSYRILWF